MLKDFRYITKRVIIGILIGLFFIGFKSCDVKATTNIITGATTKVYFQTQNCQLDNNVFNCVKGTSYKFQYQENTTNNDNTFFPFILNNQENYVLFKNMIIDIDLASPITIDNTNRSIIYNFSNSNYIYSNSNTNNNYGELFFVPDFLDTFGIDSNNTRDNRLMPYATYNFKPYYATYTDTNGVTHTSGIVFEHNNALSQYFYMVFQIPLNTQVSRVTLYLGNPTMSTTYKAYTINSNPSVKAPSGNFSIYDTKISGFDNYIYYGRRYNTYRTTDNDSKNNGLLMLQKGVAYYQPSFNVANNSNNLITSNSNYSSNTYKYYFTNYTSEQLQYFDNTIPTIEEELEEQHEDNEYNDNWASDSFGEFNNVYASNFTSLFSSLFAYPIQKITQQSEIDLVKDGGSGKVLNSLLCTRNSGFDNIIGDYDPYSIELPFGYSFDLPCPHTEIYPLLKKRGYGFYGNNFLGASLTNDVSYSFADIWLTLQHGILIYLLFVTVLNTYKYMLDPNKTEIEVLEL